MDDTLLAVGIIFTIIYCGILIVNCYAGVESGIEGQDGALCVTMTCFIVVSVPLMWLFATEDIPDSNGDVGFWIFATLPLWLLPWAIYLCLKNGACGESTKQIFCCGCC